MSDLDDLDEMFPDLGKDDPLPNLETRGTFGEGLVHRQEPPPSTDLALVAMFKRHTCSFCDSSSVSPMGWAVKRKHHSRNEVIEYQFIMNSALLLYRNLPLFCKFYDEEVDFCKSCYMARGFEDEDK